MASRACFFDCVSCRESTRRDQNELLKSNGVTFAQFMFPKDQDPNRSIGAPTGMMPEPPCFLLQNLSALLENCELDVFTGIIRPFICATTRDGIYHHISTPWNYILMIDQDDVNFCDMGVD